MLSDWIKSKFANMLVDEGQLRGGREQRRATRHPVKGPSACLSWLDHGKVTFAPVRMVNISQAGVLFVADVFLPEGLRVSMRFGDRHASWIDARVVGVGRKAQRPHWTRAVFLDPFPENVLDTAIGDGQLAAGSSAPPALEAALVTLGLEWPCNSSDVKAAFRRLSRQHHPDVGGTTEAFLAIREAFDSLSLACHAMTDSAEAGVTGPRLGQG